MAISRARMGDQIRGAMVRQVWIDEAPSIPNDGLRQFVVWTERNLDRDEIVVVKIEEYDPLVYYPDIAGVVRAKDELDAWSFVDRLNRERDRS